MNKNIYEFPDNYVVKEFLPGEIVYIISGKNAGNNGMIVSIDNNTDTAVIYNEATKSDLKVNIKDLILSNQVVYTPEKNSRFKIGEIVRIINTSNICYILDLNKFSLKVIDTHNKINNISIRDVITPKVNRRVTGIDGKKNPIEKENVIKVISGMYKGTKATIKNIYKNYVFLYNKDFVNTNGIFCELSENVEILGSELYNENEIGRINKKRIPENLKKLINKTVNIVKGNWKGYKGILKQATDKELLIELSAKQKTVKVNVGDIKEGMDGNNNIVVNNDFGNNNNNNWNTISTPAYNPTTPMSNEWG